MVVRVFKIEIIGKIKFLQLLTHTQTHTQNPKNVKLRNINVYNFEIALFLLLFYNFVKRKKSISSFAIN